MVQLYKKNKNNGYFMSYKKNIELNEMMWGKI
jgi:hypothetical protein